MASDLPFLRLPPTISLPQITSTKAKIPSDSIFNSHINNPSGASILTLIRTATSSQVFPYREILANYITETPEAHISMRVSKEWNNCFILSINLPSYAISTLDKPDNRTIQNGRPMRKWESLEFLTPRYLRPAKASGSGQGSGIGFLQETVYSFLSTGLRDDYYSVLCFDEETCKEEDQKRLPANDDEDVEEWGVSKTGLDPIVMAPEKGVTGLPRIYFIQALSVAYARIVENYENILLQYASSRRHFVSSAPLFYSPRVFFLSDI